MRWMHPPELERSRERSRFDPVVEGHRHGLSRDLALAIWATVQADATDGAGRLDVHQAQQRFHELAVRVAAHRGRLRPEVGRVTRVAADAPGARGVGVWNLRALIAPVPGRDTLVEADVRRDTGAERAAEATPAVRGGERGAAREWLEPATAARRSALDLRAWAPPHTPRPAPPPADAVPRANPPLTGWPARADRATQVREAARLYRSGELAEALRRGDPGLADAVAAALHDGSILAPHPVDVFRDSVRGLRAELAAAGRNAGRTAARLLGSTPLAPFGARAFAFADGVSGGAVRAWAGRARGWADGMARRAMAWSDGAAARGAEDELAKLSAAGGAALPAALRARMEALFGHRFAHVRIHTDAAAAQAAQAAGARAVTLGSHIYFQRGQFAPGTEAGDRLLLHELTHVVQHDHGRLPDPASGRVELSSPSDPAEREARAMEARVGEVRAKDAAAPAAVQQDAAVRQGAATPRAAAQPGSANDLPRTGKRAAADGGVLGWIDDRVHDVENWAEDKIESAVMSVAPGLATLIKEGPGGLLQNAIQPAIQGWVGSITGGVNLGQIAGQLKGSFSAAFAVLQGARAGDARCCETLVNGINAIREVAHAFMNNPVMDAIKGILTKVSDIVNTVTKLVIGPAFEVLKTIVGGAWDAIKSVASTVQGWFNAVKNIASKAFDWVAKKLGFPSGTGEGGLLDWLQQKAAELWDKIKQTLQPVIGPLKVVAGVLLMFTGLPEICAIIKYGPQLVEAVQWLWANRNNPDAVKQNPKLLGGSILPKILGAGQSFVGMVKTAVAWLVDKTTAFATGALNLLGAITGIPLLSMARGFVQNLVDGVKGVEAWAAGAFTSAASGLEDLFHKVADFIKPYAEVLCSVAAAVINPTMIPMILAGWAWRWLPDCIKPPLIDLLLDAVIAVLEGMPALPMLGPLWPLLKAGVLGFLHALRARDPETKIKVSNKLAKIISGASPMFLLGFVKGLLRGVWDGIKMPFEAIWMVAKGIQKAGDFFVALGSEADTKATAHPAAAPARPAAPAGHPAPASPHALPSTPSVIQPDQAASVVGGIVAQLNAQKPPRPTAPAAAPPQPGAPAGQTNQYRELGHEAHRMAGELSGPAHTVATGFWPAVQQLFSSGKGMSADDLMAKLGKVWNAAKAAVASLGGKIANMICDFLVKDEAEEQIGDTIGYLVGMIAFQALLDYLSAGTWTGAMGVLSAIAKFLNWPMEFLGEAMRVLKQLGGFILDGLKSLGSMIAEAGAGALREVTGAFREIGTKLGEFAEEILAKFRGEADGTAAKTLESDVTSTAGKDAASTAEKDAASTAEKDAATSAAEKEAQKAEELAEAIEVSRMIVRAEDAGHIPGPAVAVSLEALKARYRWIKGYEAEPTGAGYEVYLIASKHDVGKTGKGKLDPGGRGLWDLDEALIDKLPKAEADELRALQAHAPTSEAELRRLVELRTKAAGGELGLVAGTPEHTLDRWERYKLSDRPTKQDFTQWMNGQPSRMANSAAGNAVEDEYRAALKEADINGRSAVVTSEGQRRQVDVLVEGTGDEQRTMIQIKSGDESLTTKPRQSGGSSRGASSLSNEQALAVDKRLATSGDRVIWVFEQKASGPLVRRALDSGVEVVMRIDAAAGKDAAIKLIEAAGMPAADIERAIASGKLVFVEGDRASVIDRLAKMLGGGS